MNFGREPRPHGSIITGELSFGNGDIPIFNAHINGKIFDTFFFKTYPAKQTGNEQRCIYKGHFPYFPVIFL